MDGTAAMIARLAPLSAETDPAVNRFANEAIVAAMRSRVPSPAPDQQLLYQRQLAEQLLYAGEHAEAIARFEGLLEDLDAYQARVRPDQRAPESFRRGAIDLLAISHFRLAEQEGCILEGDATDCAIPSPTSPWPDSEAMREALRLYGQLLAEAPDDLGPRWLLNLAHMMLGQYPEGVPERWRIPPDAFEVEHEIGAFRNVAGALGVDVIGNVGGAVMDDFDGDGLLDLMASSWGPADTLRIFLNDGAGGFVDHTAASGTLGLFGGGNLQQADYDNDGDIDVFVPRGGWLVVGQPNSLLRNEGGGVFIDVTEAAGLLSDQPHPSQTAVWADLNGDGWLDLYVGNETYTESAHPAELYLSSRDGTFREVAVEAGAAVVGTTKGVTAGDYDNDGDMDLYVANKGQPNVLLRNDGPSGGVPRFTDVTPEAGVVEPLDAFPTWFFDYDNDGKEDLFVAGYRTDYGDAAAEYLGRSHTSELPRLYRNLGDGTFEDVSVAVGLDRILFAMGSNFGDLDNDGWLDMYVGTGDAFFQALLPNRMLRNDRGSVFQEVTAAGFGLFQKGHGVSFGDLDHDGDQDFYVTMGGAFAGDLARNVLFLNPGHGNRWITLELDGTESNRSAIGARVRVVATDEDGGARTIHRTVGSGSSFGANSLRMHIGLGRGSGGVTIEVDWPRGERQRFEDVLPERAYRVVEGALALEELELPSVDLPATR
jgi:hypothetical protein